MADCQPGKRFLFISEEGVASPCHFTAQDCGIPLAQLDRADDLIELAERFARGQREWRLAACEDCQSTRVFEKFAA